MKISSVVGVIFAGVFGAFLLGVSGPSCSCSTPTMEFGWEIDLVDAPDYAATSDLTPSNVQRAMRAKYVGVPLSDLTPPTALLETPCKRSAQELNCAYLVGSGVLRDEGLLIKFVADKTKKVAAVDVQGFNRWFGAR